MPLRNTPQAQMSFDSSINAPRGLNRNARVATRTRSTMFLTRNSTPMLQLQLNNVAILQLNKCCSRNSTDFARFWTLDELIPRVLCGCFTHLTRRFATLSVATQIRLTTNHNNTDVCSMCVLIHQQPR